MAKLKEKLLTLIVGFLFWGCIIAVVTWVAMPYATYNACVEHLEKKSKDFKTDFAVIKTIYGRKDKTGSHLSGVVVQNFDYTESSSTIVCYFYKDTHKVAFYRKYSGDVSEKIFSTTKSRLWSVK